MIRIQALALALLATAATRATAQQPIDQTVPSSATGSVEIVNTSGHVRVVGWNRPEIRITGTLGRGSERLAVEGGRDRTAIRVVIPRNARDVRGTDLEVRVPAGKDVTVRTTSADIQADGVNGSVTARSTSGDVQVAGKPRQVVAASTSGDVDLRVTTLQVRANTTSGDVRVEGAVGERVAAESVSGDVRVTATTPELQARSLSGDLEISGVGRRVTASTVSGEARIRAGRIQYGSFESVSGGLRFEGDLQPDAAFSIQSHGGDVELVLPESVAASFQVSTFSGDIDNDFGPAAQAVSRYGPGRELRFARGAGGATVVVKTFSGSVKLLRR